MTYLRELRQLGSLPPNSCPSVTRRADSVAGFTDGLTIAATQKQVKVGKLRLDTEVARFSIAQDLIDRLPESEQSVVAAQLLRQLMGTTEAIANDARVDETKILEPAAGGSIPSHDRDRQGDDGF